MMERTYGRRKPEMLRTYSDSFNDTVSQVEYLSSSLSPDIEEPLDFSTQESTSLWNFSSRSNFFDDDDFSQKRAKRPRNGGGAFGGLNSTLMEAQEFGELMGNEDEVNFALDGLKKGHHVMIRRAALSSLLSIFEFQHQRRSLRALGTSQSILDAILGLSLDDTASNLAAATLFFVLTADGQDDHFMESSNSIKFLIKLLRPVISVSTKGKPRNIGSRLLSVIKDVDAARDAANMHDSSSCDIFSRAQDILVNCKELRLIDSYKIGRMRPELSTKWLALLLMEKACLSKISFDDTAGTVKKTDGMFEEKLRELGGLDAVFDVVMDCHAVMESWVAHDTLSVEDIKDDLNKQSLMLLLKCLKIMENATFLSTENQNHLLGFNKSMGSHRTRPSFPVLMINVIKILSGLQLCARRNEKHPHPRRVNGVNSDSILGVKCKANKEVVTISSDTWSITSCSSMRSASVSERNRSAFLLDCSVTSMAGDQSSVVSINDSCMLTTRAGSNTGSFAGRLASLGSAISRSNSSQVREPICKKFGNSGSLEDSQDPYAFDLEDSGPSKRAAVSKKKSKDRKRKGSYRDNKDERSPQLFSSQEESNHCLNSQEESSDRDCHVTEQPSSTYDIDKGCLCLLSDCLLTAVKVLMNLTNENSVGCREVAACRGLESMAELIAGHFPSFIRSPLFSKLEMPGTRHPKNKHLTEEELDFLVAILGLLVNLVEKDGTNRSRLAAASVPITDPEGLQESEQDMIPLLCSIFLTNQASSDTTEETSTFTLDDEEAVLQSEKEAEKMIVEAYSALLLAFLSTQSTSIRNAIRDYLPKRNLAILVPVLDRFVAFHTTLDMIPPETHKAVMKVIESCKLP
ncbi:Wings apart-like protein 2 [Cardamine amara subsp. amara]|uniref:Wings apart-like protein 2 n=1 Tax=Cardamine amara subsp. amara TaxID=228776 RepID=A0ABD1CA80_CARAN